MTWRAKLETKPGRLTVKRLLTLVCTSRFVAPKGPLHVRYAPGRSKLVLVLGDNATGKSFVRRLVQGHCHLRQTECIALSQQGRCADPLMSGGGVRAMIYGTEEWQSTGENSAGTVLMAIKTSRARDAARHTVFWDEPDTGLSDEYALGAADEIATYVGYDSAPGLVAAFVVSHRREFIRRLAIIEPHVLFVGEDPPASLDAWLSRPVVARSLDELRDRSLATFRALSPLLKER